MSSHDDNTNTTQYDRRDELQREMAKWEGIVQEAAEAKLEAEIAEAGGR